MIRWGILGTGKIARRLAKAIAVLPDAELAAIGSRSAETAEAFGHEFSVPCRFDRYEDLVACPDVDVVYVATPHSRHLQDATLALEAGKPVLCEKPLTVNVREAEELIATARRERLFLMEAMWTRFVPAVVRLREWIEEGAIGEIRFLTANIGKHHAFDPDSRLFDRELAGGALLDVGVYPVSFASMLLGTPSEASGVMQKASSGVDEQCSISLAYPSGALTSFAATLVGDTPQDGLIIGTKGWIHVHRSITHPETLTRGSLTGEPKTLEIPHLGNGYPHQVIEVMKCLRAGRMESEIMSLDESLSIIRTLDSIREPWGLRYPADGAE